MNQYLITTNKPNGYISKIADKTVWYVLYLGAVVASTNSEDTARRMVKEFEQGSFTRTPTPDDSAVFTDGTYKFESNSGIAYIFILNLEGWRAEKPNPSPELKSKLDGSKNK